MIDVLQKFLPFLDQYLSWVRGMVALWVCLTAAIVVALIFIPRAPTAVVSGSATANSESDRMAPSTESLGRSPSDFGPLFSSTQSLPLSHALVRPGSRLSLAKATYASGKFEHIHGEPYFDVAIETGPFSSVLYYYSQSDIQPDTEILYVTFMLRNDGMSEFVARSALERFGPEHVKALVDGRLLWDDVDGIKIKFEPNRSLEYSLSQ